MSEDGSALLLIIHGTWTIHNLQFMILQPFFYDLCIGLFSKSQTSLYKVLCFGNYSPTIKVGAILDLSCFTYDSPSVEILVFSWDLFCLHSMKQYGKTCLLYRYRFSIVLKYFCSWFSSTTYWCSFWSISTTHRWLRQLFRYVCLSSAGRLAPETNRINSGNAFCIVSDSHTYQISLCILSEHVEHSAQFMKTLCKLPETCNFWCQLYVPQGDRQMTTLHYCSHRCFVPMLQKLHQCIVEENHKLKYFRTI